MQATTTTDPVLRWAARREAINRANSEHSTGPRTQAGKQRSSQNALRHGLTSRTAVLPTEDPAVYEQHCRHFRDEYQPANATETQLVQQLADTSWRLNRIPLIETELLAQAPSPESLVPQLSSLGLYSSRLSRQFQKTLDQLITIQSDRKHQERRDLRAAAELLELHKRRGISWQPADHGFVFSKDQVERHDELLMRQNEAHHCAWARYEMPPTLMRSFIA
jgi:AraC-like DNA-binding protein